MLKPERRRVQRGGFGGWLERLHLLRPRWETVWLVGGADQKTVRIMPIPNLREPE